jgi:hypothetical protein
VRACVRACVHVECVSQYVERDVRGVRRCVGDAHAAAAQPHPGARATVTIVSAAAVGVRTVHRAPSTVALGSVTPAVSLVVGAYTCRAAALRDSYCAVCGHQSPRRFIIVVVLRVRPALHQRSEARRPHGACRRCCLPRVSCSPLSPIGTYVCAADQGPQACRCVRMHVSWLHDDVRRRRVAARPCHIRCRGDRRSRKCSSKCVECVRVCGSMRPGSQTSATGTTTTSSTARGRRGLRLLATILTAGRSSCSACRC